MGPWRAAARGVAVEVLRFIVSGWGEKDHCPVTRDWRAEDQTAYWREEALSCRDRLREAYSCSAELEFLRNRQEACWDTPAVLCTLLLGIVVGAVCASACAWWLHRPRAGIVVAEIAPGKGEPLQELTHCSPAVGNELVAARQRARSLRG